MSYFQLSTLCLDILMKHCFLCLIYYITPSDLPVDHYQMSHRKHQDLSMYYYFQMPGPLHLQSLYTKLPESQQQRINVNLTERGNT